MMDDLEDNFEGNLNFSWGDSFKAFLNSASSCLPLTLVTRSRIQLDQDRSQDRGWNGRVSNRVGNAELDRLLVDSEGGNGRDGDALSLHSNLTPGSSAVRLGRRKKGRGGKGVFGRCLGIDCFGRRGVSLPIESEEEEDEGRGRTTTLVDSLIGDDEGPTPLTDSRLEELLESRLKKNMNSGRSGLIQDQYTPHSPMHSHLSPRQTRDEFRPFQEYRPHSHSLPQLHPQSLVNLRPLVLPSNRQGNDNEEDEEEIDFDAGTYTRTIAERNIGSGSGSTSHSRSYTQTRSARSYKSLSDDTRSHTSVPDPLTQQELEEVDKKKKEFEGFDDELVLPPLSTTSRKRSKSKSKSKSKSRSKSANMSVTSEGTSNGDSASLASPPPVEYYRDLMAVKEEVGIGGVKLEDGVDEADRIHGLF